jgi:DNA primase
MAKINEQDIDTLRERADIVEVISAYSSLKKSGPNAFKGLCPFHSEKTPSFTVDATRGLFYCFGCGEGGNIYHFIEKIENLGFRDSVEWLARKTGFDLRYEEMRPGEKKAAGLKLRIIAANAEATRFFQKQLMELDDAIPARRYLGGRHFDRKVADRWQLGYAPGRNALTRHLLSRGFTQEEILAADLGRKSERDGSLYDSFRNRIIFPTWNLQGDVVGFGARALGDQQPKYLNTSETPVFQKSRVMYGLNRAKSAIARSQAVVVEGYTDVIALHEAGIEEAVATNGVALGETHFELLRRFCPRAVLMFDSDEAGKGATERGFSLQHKLGFEVLVAPLPAGRDPAEVAQEDGPDAVNKVIEAAQPLMEFKLEQTIARLPLDTPEAKGRAVRAVAEVLGWHPDPVARHEYAFTAARYIGVDPEALHRALSERRSNRDGETAVGDERNRRVPGHVKVEREALQLLLTRTKEVAPFVGGILESDFTSASRRELFKEANAALESGRMGVDAAVERRLSPDARSLFTELTVASAAQQVDETLPDQLGDVFDRLRVFRLAREIRELRATLQEVNPLVDPKQHDSLFTDLVALEAERRDLLRRLQGAV